MEVLTGFSIPTVCSVDGCDKPIDCKGLCNVHYQRWNLYGRTHSVVWGQSSHPLYNMWNERKNKGHLCEKWCDFKVFINDVGERPSDGDFRMGRLEVNKPFSPDNFFWKEYLIRKPDETDNQFAARRRKTRYNLYKHKELVNSYDLSLIDYNKMLAAQNYVCAICGKPEKTIHHVTNEPKALAVDHCHKTGKVRGLLCQRCNRVLGKVRDSIDLLDKMKVYLNGNRT